MIRSGGRSRAALHGERRCPRDVGCAPGTGRPNAQPRAVFDATSGADYRRLGRCARPSGARIPGAAAPARCAGRPAPPRRRRASGCSSLHTFKHALMFARRAFPSGSRCVERRASRLDAAVRARRHHRAAGGARGPVQPRHRGDQPAAHAVLDDFGRTAHARRQHRRPGREGLQHDMGQTLICRIQARTGPSAAAIPPLAGPDRAPRKMHPRSAAQSRTASLRAPLARVHPRR